MRNFFKRLFGRKYHITIDYETAGISRDTKKDFDNLTKALHTMPVKVMNFDEPNARILQHNIGVDIEILEHIMNQRIPSLKDAEPTMHPVTEGQDDHLTRRIKELIS